MGGGLMQLVAYGAQDIYLTGNPQITFFKVVYRRHTNFSMESIEQTFNGTPAYCSRVSCTISRNGDLVHKMHLRFQNTDVDECSCSVSGIMEQCLSSCSPIPLVERSVSDEQYDAWSAEAEALNLPVEEWVAGFEDLRNANNKNANNLIKSIEVEIGGQRVDKHYGDWLNIWAQLTTPLSKNAGLNRMLDTHNGTFSYVPLRFWFNRNPGLALPLIALQYHEVKLNIEFAKSGGSNYIVCGGACPEVPINVKMGQTKLFVDYIYLDTDERRRFAQVSHEYLIEQLQFTGSTSLSDSADVNERLNFNHPVKELVWRASGAFSKQYKEIQGQTASGVTNGIIGDIGPSPDCGYVQWTDITLQLNGHERFTPRHSEYFRLVQPYEHHTAVPVTSGIHVYSFALKPEEHQPSGTCNFSRIDNAVLKCNGGTKGASGVVLNIYAVNYNVLRIMSGMGGLAYSN